MDASDGDNVRRSPQADLPVIRLLPDLIERLRQHVIKFLTYAIQSPFIMLKILYPLEVTDCHAPGIRHDVRQNRHTAFVKDSIGIRVDGTVGAFEDDVCPDLIHIVHRDHATKRGRGFAR